MKGKMTDLTNINTLQEIGNAAFSCAEKETDQALRGNYIHLAMAVSHIGGMLSKMNRTQPKPEARPASGDLTCSRCGKTIGVDESCYHITAPVCLQCEKNPKKEFGACRNCGQEIYRISDTAWLHVDSARPGCCGAATPDR